MEAQAKTITNHWGYTVNKVEPQPQKTCHLVNSHICSSTHCKLVIPSSTTLSRKQHSLRSLMASHMVKPMDTCQVFFSWHLWHWHLWHCWQLPLNCEFLLSMFLGPLSLLFLLLTLWPHLLVSFEGLFPLGLFILAFLLIHSLHTATRLIVLKGKFSYITTQNKSFKGSIAFIMKNKAPELTLRSCVAISFFTHQSHPVSFSPHTVPLATSGSREL